MNTTTTADVYLDWLHTRIEGFDPAARLEAELQSVWSDPDPTPPHGTPR